MNVRKGSLFFACFILIRSFRLYVFVCCLLCFFQYKRVSSDFNKCVCFSFRSLSTQRRLRTRLSQNEGRPSAALSPCKLWAVHQ